MENEGVITLEIGDVSLDEAAASTIERATPGRWTRLRVSDTGGGIPDEIRDKIFEPFFTTKPIGKGTGLGLSTCIGILKHHGAALDLSSEMGRGTTFDIYFPTAHDHQFVERAPVADGGARGNGETILVVDDEAAVRNMTETILTDHGYSVYLAKNGSEALAILDNENNNIALAVVDLTMPAIDGSQPIAALQSRKPGLAIIAMSRQAVVSPDVLAGLTAKGIVVLSKPCAGDKLLAAIQKTLSESIKSEIK